MIQLQRSVGLRPTAVKSVLVSSVDGIFVSSEWLIRDPAADVPGPVWTEVGPTPTSRPTTNP
jgi:hypothetical protein